MKIFIGLLSLLTTACAYFPRSTPSPVRALVDEPVTEAQDLVVVLPGRFSLPRELEREGFIQRVRASRPHARIIVPDLHLGYYRNRTVMDRIHHDIVLPARREGIRRVTLVGISMGGLGAMLYEFEHPGQVQEIILLSPFLGDESVIADITAQGGLQGWTPEGEGPDAFSHDVWLRLRDSWLTRSDRPVLRLGCGNSDRLASTSRLADRELAPEATIWLSGGHDWPTWNKLFENIESAAPRKSGG